MKIKQSTLARIIGKETIRLALFHDMYEIVLVTSDGKVSLEDARGRTKKFLFELERHKTTEDYRYNLLDLYPLSFEKSFVVEDDTFATSKIMTREEIVEFYGEDVFSSNAVRIYNVQLLKDG